MVISGYVHRGKTKTKTMTAMNLKNRLFIIISLKFGLNSFWVEAVTKVGSSSLNVSQPLHRGEGFKEWSQRSWLWLCDECGWCRLNSIEGSLQPLIPTIPLSMLFLWTLALPYHIVMENVNTLSFSQKVELNKDRLVDSKLLQLAEKEHALLHFLCDGFCILKC